MMKKWIGILLAALMLTMLPLTALADGEGEGSDAVTITHEESSDTYKAWLMDSFDKTLLGKDKNLRNQISKILYRDEITVSAENYRNILRYVDNAINRQTLSENASISHYTDADFAIAAELIEHICDELDLDYSIDPSNDSQNEYARVITVKKNGKLLGKINSDAKTDVANKLPVGWIVAGGVLIAAAAMFGVVLVVRMGKKKKEAA